jgi:hypothetical protein
LYPLLRGGGVKPSHKALLASQLLFGDPLS